MLRFQALPRVTEETADETLEGHAVAADQRRLLHQAGAENGFQRAHEAAFRAVHVFMHGGAAGAHAAILEAEEEGGRDGDVLAFHRDEAWADPGCVQANGGVGGAEIDTTMKAGHRRRLAMLRRALQRAGGDWSGMRLPV